MTETTDRPKNRAAQALGKRGKGKPKTITPEEREKRRQRMLALRARLAKKMEEDKASAAPPSNAGDHAEPCPECSATGQHYATCSRREE